MNWWPDWFPAICPGERQQVHKTDLTDWDDWFFSLDAYQPHHDQLSSGALGRMGREEGGGPQVYCVTQSSRSSLRF